MEASARRMPCALVSPAREEIGSWTDGVDDLGDQVVGRLEPERGEAEVGQNGAREQGQDGVGRGLDGQDEKQGHLQRVATETRTSASASP